MTTATLFGPSEKQIAFINALIDERELTEDARKKFRADLAVLDKRSASQLITVLVNLPKRTDLVGKMLAGKTSLQEALSKAPKSKYAIPNDELDISLDTTRLTGDHLFVEIREYMGNLYMRRLHGSLGGFTRVRIANSDAITIMDTISRDPYKYARIFGEIYSCCGSCGAELTDPKSRELQLGPECRKKFGK
jgi:hypothetical protein